MGFWNTVNLRKLSEVFAAKYEKTDPGEWVLFLRRNDCGIMQVNNIHDTCELVNLREDLENFVLVGCNNDCEIIFVPKDFAAAAVVLGEMPAF
jgi:hypothetical protein